MRVGSAAHAQLRAAADKAAARAKGARKMSDGPKVVSSDHKGPNNYLDALKEATEPCAWLTLRAHGTHNKLAEHELYVGNELDEGLLVPQSWFGRMEKLLGDMAQLWASLKERVAALEHWRTQFTLDVHGRVVPSAFPAQMEALEKRLAALEEWVPSGVAWEEPKRPEKRDPHRFDHLRPNAVNVQLDQMVESFGSIEAAGGAIEEVRFPTEGVEKVPKGWTGDGEVWRTGTIAIQHCELEGLDLHGFKEMLRAKVDRLWHSLIEEWEREGKANADDV